MKNKMILAGCVIYDENKKILLLHRNTPGRVQWETPGGKIENGETSGQTAIREVKEELGIDVEIIKEIGRKDFQEDNFIMEYVWILSKIIKGSPKPMEEKYDQCKYFSLSELNKIKNELSPNARNLLEYLSDYSIFPPQ